MTLRPRDRVALAVVLAFALVGAFYLLALKPQQKKASALSAAIVSQRRALSTAEANYAAGRAAQASIKADAAEWAALRKAVPNTSDIPALLRVLERNANAVHVRMQAIALSGSSGSASGTSPSTTTPSTGGAATGGAATGGASGPTSVALSLTFAGGYIALHNLVRRLDGLVVVSGNKVHATGPLLSISSVSLTGSPKLTVQLTATIYQLAAPAAATAATTGGQS